MAAVAHARRAHLDGALPLAALLAATVLLAPLHGAAYGVAVLYLVFAAAMAARGADRPGEPPLAWRLYAAGAGALAVGVALRGLDRELAALATAPVVLLTAGLAVHLRAKARHGVRRHGLPEALAGLAVASAAAVVLPGTVAGVAAPVAFGLAALLTACGRRAHDARIGRTLQAACLALLAAAALSGPLAAALYAVAGWLLTAASVAERAAGVTSTPAVPPPGAEPSPAA